MWHGFILSLNISCDFYIISLLGITKLVPNISKFGNRGIGDIKIFCLKYSPNVKMMTSLVTVKIALSGMAYEELLTGQNCFM